MTPLLLMLIGGMAMLYGYAVGKSQARRLDALCHGLRQGQPQAIGIIVLVAVVLVAVGAAYVLLGYEPPSR